jgi:glycerol-3-phosphate acyltransferase PlsY
MEYGGIIGVTNVILSLAVLIMLLYYFKFRATLDELSRRFLFAGLFLGIHELTFFLGDSFIYELTKTLFFITLFYSLIFVVRHNSAIQEKLTEQETFNTELKKRLEDLKKEIT